MDGKEFGKYIKSLRKAAGLSQVDLGKMVGCAGSTIGRIENGGFKAPSPNLFIAMAPILGVSKHDLMEKYGYIDKDDFGKNGFHLTAKERAIAAISDDDELLSFFTDIVEREDLRIIMRQTRMLKPSTIKQVIRMIQVFEGEGEKNGVD